MGIGLELYQWAAKRGLEIPLLIFLLALTILLIIIAMNFKYEIRTTSPFRDCIYVKKDHETDTITCSLYKHKPLFIREQQLECPIDQLK
ncbi:hypothetical protein GCM10023142_37870 [Anaerocolumna aminovalerica]|uniref:Uncharacterized protein n=1 Tax=Anaerocolumna aminovalerica TaxID=1527 RepID=A0A1I5CY57_9FIRM|nr:hypothetical protein [Anaerocolumna aminovalerica]SFN91925.1 hypothetical protein SAMN04489757_104113 [Anaerocolumna aminovalerica]